jgi:hypothetical protein
MDAPSGRNNRGQFVKSTDKNDLIPVRPVKTHLSASTALRLDTSVKDDVTAAIEKATKRAGIDRALKAFEQEEKPAEKPRKLSKPKPASAAAAPSSNEAAPSTTVPPTEAAPAAEAPKPAKLTVGGREYTLEEVQSRLEEIDRAQQAQKEAPPSAAPQPPAPTAEELAAAEHKWVNDYSEVVDTPFTEDEMDTLLTGGQEAVELMQKMRKRDIAYAVLQAKKNIAEGLNPVLQQLFSTVHPLAQHFESLQRYTVTQQFVSQHPHLKDHMDLAKQVAETLVQKHPREWEAMSPEQKINEVARQTTQILDNQWKRFNNSGSWRDATKTQAAPVPLPPPAAPRPLASNPPSAAPAAPSGNWQSAVAKSLRR